MRGGAAKMNLELDSVAKFCSLQCKSATSSDRANYINGQAVLSTVYNNRV